MSFTDDVILRYFFCKKITVNGTQLSINISSIKFFMQKQKFLSKYSLHEADYNIEMHNFL